MDNSNGPQANLSRAVKVERQSENSVKALAQKLRQSFQTCTSHSIGPVTAFNHCWDLQQSGQLSEREFQEIGIEIIHASQRYLERCEAANYSENDKKFLILREQKVINFTRALFSL